MVGEKITHFLYRWFHSLKLITNGKRTYRLTYKIYTFKNLSTSKLTQILDCPMDYSSKNHSFFQCRNFQDTQHQLKEDESSSNMSYHNVDVESNTNTDLSDNEVIDIIGDTQDCSRYRQ